MEGTSSQTKRLQGCINDLTSILALPALWSGQHSSDIGKTLLDVLVRVLALDFAWARISIDHSHVEVVRLADRYHTSAQAQVIGRALSGYLTGDLPTSARRIPNPIGAGEVSVAVLRLGLQDIGVIAAVSHRADFPTDIERLLLRVAANQAAIGLQEARRLSEQKRAAAELEQRVAERTAQLESVNEELRKQFIVRERAEEDLRRSEAHLAQGQKISHSGSCVWKVRTGAILFSQEHCRIFGLDPASAQSSYATFLKCVHPEDQPLVEGAVHHACGARADFEMDYRIVRPDGSIRYVHALGHPSINDSGEVTEYIVSVMDVTERTRAEGALRASEERSRRYFDLGLVGMAITSPGKVCIEVNDELCRILGYDREELLQKTWAEMTHPDDVVADVENFDRVMAGEMDGYTLDKRWIRKDGRIIDSIMAAQCVRSADGSVDYFVGLVQDITERKRAEEALRRSEAYLAEGQKLSHTASWAWNVSTGEIFWSRELFRIYGLDPEKAKPGYPSVLDYIHSHDRSRAQKTFEDAVRERRDYELAYRVAWTDGTIRHVNSIAHPVFDKAGTLIEYVGTTIDTTDRIRAEAAVRETLARVEMILDSITDRFFAVDSQWRYTHFNKHAEQQLRILGKDPAGMLGKVLWDEFPNPPYEEAIRRAMSERVAVNHEHYYASLGEWVEKRIYPSPDGGLAMFVTYVTERKRAEEELHRTQSELAHVSRVTALGELAASIAHEINQPLGAIVNNGSVCLRLLAGSPGCPREAHEALADIVKDAERAAAVITRIRFLIKKSVPEKVSVTLQDLITEVLGLAHRKLEHRSIVVRTEIQEDLPQFEADRVQLQQVLLNLVVNGIEAMSAVEEGHRILSISARSQVEQDDPSVLVSVSDSGCGLPPNQMDRIFEAFYTTRPNGMGMGLRISRSIIEAHGGRLSATSNPDRGATFSFTLPVGGAVEH